MADICQRLLILLPDTVAEPITYQLVGGKAVSRGTTTFAGTPNGASTNCRRTRTTTEDAKAVTLQPERTLNVTSTFEVSCELDLWCMLPPAADKFAFVLLGEREADAAQGSGRQFCQFASQSGGYGQNRHHAGTYHANDASTTAPSVVRQYMLVHAVASERTRSSTVDANGF